MLNINKINIKKIYSIFIILLILLNFVNKLIVIEPEAKAYNPHKNYSYRNYTKHCEFITNDKMYLVVVYESNELPKWKFLNWVVDFPQYHEQGDVDNAVGYIETVDKTISINEEEGLGFECSLIGQMSVKTATEISYSLIKGNTLTYNLPSELPTGRYSIRRCAYIKKYKIDVFNAIGETRYKPAEFVPFSKHNDRFVPYFHVTGYEYNRDESLSGLQFEAIYGDVYYELVRLID